MKKCNWFLLLAALFLCFPLSGQAKAAAKTSPTIVLDGQAIPMQKKDKVEIINGSVMVPLRIIAENMGMGVIWNQQAGTVTIPKESGSVELTIGHKEALIDGTSHSLSTAPRNHSGTTLVPLRFISEAMGVQVSWDNSRKVVGLTSAGPPAVQPDSGPATDPAVIAAPANPEGTAPPAALPVIATGTSTLSGLSFSDNRLMLAFTGDVQPSVHTGNEPLQIVVELPLTSFSADFLQTVLWDSSTLSGEQAITGVPGVSRMAYELSGTDASTVRVTLFLTAVSRYTTYIEEDAAYRLLVVDLNTLSPEPLPVQPVQPGNGKKIIVIDAGHGAADPGTIGITKTLEKDFNLSLALKVEALLLKDPAFQVVMTRRDDTYPANKRRAEMANELQADAFVSIHANSVEGRPEVRGTESYYYSQESRAFADIMHKHLLGATGFTDRKVKYNKYIVLKYSNMPATLLEVGFLSNAAEEAALFSDDFQNRVAAALVAGLKEYFGVN
ncbi:N-acetylmuramoyl-L-alanine amidase [Paenibacillus sp. FSL P4-0338]|uniref:N-acetylmuramoyl-L-alanine amidase n=1 Tax=unclassified Paenibacillus TaxID=185978 RepID=UPI0003E214B3|nr:N-acetylmuramoyl-L-alanine amidase [Paenibacillus sp. FSL R7-269]ETT56218.1 N-acetylmuramoyl-L-alanine amidase [Paenibacillus sp. FSL R7-269]